MENDARAVEEVIEPLEPLRASGSELARTSAGIKVDESDIVAHAAIADAAAV